MIGLFDLLILIAGLRAKLGRALIVLHGLGLIMSGPWLMLTGFFLARRALVSRQACR